MMRRDEEALRMLRRAEEIAPARVRLHPIVPGVLADIRDRRQRATVGRELRGLLYRMGLPH